MPESLTTAVHRLALVPAQPFTWRLGSLDDSALPSPWRTGYSETPGTVVVCVHPLADEAGVFADLFGDDLCRWAMENIATTSDGWDVYRLWAV